MLVDCCTKNNISYVCCIMQIKASEVDFWKYDEDDLKLMQVCKLYPPARSFVAYTTASDTTAVISFEVRTSNSEYFPLKITKQFCLGKLIQWPQERIYVHTYNTERPAMPHRTDLTGKIKKILMDLLLLTSIL